MAQINVSTWAELVAALSDVPSTAGVDTTILLTADIDMVPYRRLPKRLPQCGGGNPRFPFLSAHKPGA